jgi:hypothetical protein
MNPKSFEHRDVLSQQRRPMNNDVVLVDGRYAEVYAVNDEGMDFRFMDAASEIGRVMWSGADLVRAEDTSLDLLDGEIDLPEGDSFYQNRLGSKARFFGEYRTRPVN